MCDDNDDERFVFVFVFVERTDLLLNLPRHILALLPLLLPGDVHALLGLHLAATAMMMIMIMMTTTMMLTTKRMNER